MSPQVGRNGELHSCQTVSGRGERAPSGRIRQAFCSFIHQDSVGAAELIAVNLKLGGLWHVTTHGRHGDGRIL